MRWLPTSVRTRLTLWYTVALTLPLVVFAMTSYFIFSRTLRGRTDAFLDDALTVFAAELTVERGRVPTIEDAVRTTVGEVRFQDLDIAVVDEGGNLVGVSPPRANRRRTPVRSPLDVGPVMADIIARLESRTVETVRRAEGTYRVRVRRAPVDDATLRLVGVYPLMEVEATLARIRGLFLIAIPILIATAAAGGSFLARRSFRPVSQMAGRAAEIGASTLHERLPVVADDELGALARVLNDLLDRLERSFAQQRRFMADASHELRTPTTIVRTEADVTLSRDSRREAEYRASMEIVRDASRRLTRIVDDIFLLARADAGHLVMQAAPLYLEDLVRDTVRAVRPIADARRVRVEMRDLVEGAISGDADLLGRLILNLLDNAIKYSPAGGTIDVVVIARDGAFELAVTDHGPGIPPNAHERVFERFYRVDSARSRHESTLTSGAGLGLPICRRIAEMHGGTVVLADSRPGHTEFRVRLPAVPSKQGAPASISA